MRIAQLLPAMEVGGVERGVAELSRALAAAGHESIVISRAGALCGDIAAGGGRHIPFDSGGKNPLTALPRAYRLRVLLGELMPDIVHVRSRVPAWLLALAGSRAKVVSTFHGIYSVSRYSAQMTRAAAVICPSNAVRAHIRQHYRTPAERLHLIHRGVDMQYFDPARADAAACEALRRDWRLGGHTVFALVGRVSALKGHDLFLRALARLQSARALAKPPLALVVGAQENARTARLRQLARELGVEAAARFCGVRREMREVYACSDVVVSASTQPEAFGRTVAEGLGMARAAVAPAHGGALDIVTDGENGALFAPGDAAALADAMQRAAQLPRDGLRRSVEKFTLARMVEQTIQVYRHCLEKPPAA